MKNKKEELLPEEKINNALRDITELLIPVIIFMIPLIFILYVCFLHGYISGEWIRLDKIYKVFVFILGIMYLFRLITEDFKIRAVDIPLLIFMVLTIISTIFAYDTNVALTGFNNRYEGMWTLLFYGFTYLSIRSIDHKAKTNYLLKCLGILSMVHMVCIFTQLTGYFEEIFPMYSSHAPTSLTENCNFSGAFFTLLSSFTMGAFLLFKKEDNYPFYFICFCLSYAGLLFANSSGPFLGFLGVLFFLTIYLIKSKKFNWRKYLWAMVVIVGFYPLCLTGIMHNDLITSDLTGYVTGGISLIKQAIGGKEENKEEIEVYTDTETGKLMQKYTDSATGKLVEKEYTDTALTTDDAQSELSQYGGARVLIWTNVLRTITKSTKSILIGYGPDNLGLVYMKSANETLTADKAHNIYLHMWSGSGIFAMLAYIAWVVISLIKAFKSKNTFAIVLAFAVLGYSLQGLFNINVSEVTPYFYIAMGLMILYTEKEEMLQKELAETRLIEAEKIRKLEEKKQKEEERQAKLKEKKEAKKEKEKETKKTTKKKKTKKK